MKKIFIIALLLFYGVANAQNYLSVNITEIQEQQVFEFCVSDYDSIIFTKESSCNNQVAWGVRDWSTQQIIQQAYDELVLIPNSAIQLEIIYHAEGCNIVHRVFNVIFRDFSANEPWTQAYVWKGYGTTISLGAPYGDDLQYQWSTGSHQQSINLTEPGVYWVRIYNDCGELTDTIQVRDNVEISLATCDLESNLNMVTWPTTMAQAEYVDHLNVKRDGITVATANYSDGFFLDNIGSDAAPRTYSLVAVGTDGTECPIESYPKETIHMSYLLGVGNTVEVGWNQPSGYDLLGYNICEWNPNDKDGDLTVIDFVGAGVSSYTCSESQFDHGMIVVQGVERTKAAESRLLSNRSLDYVGLGEKENKIFNLYPNPTTGRVTIEGTGRLTIMNTLGQTLLTRDITDTETIDLPSGVWFVNLNGVTRKVVVE